MRSFTDIYTKENIFALMEKFVKCSSISGTKEEIEMAKTVYNVFADTDYFRAHPQQLALHPLANDMLGRYLVTALVKGQGQRTVVLLNHFDTVDYEGFGVYKHLATDPRAFTAAIDPAHLPEDAAADLASGEWLFGRGVADMKCGGAVEAALTCAFADGEPNMQGNILFLGVGDEETNSAGMATAVTVLEQLRQQYDLEYVTVINNEPHLLENGKHRMDLGTVGKAMPAFFCAGKEGHAGLMFNALSGSAMLAEVMSELEFTMELTDHLDGVYTMPATALKIGDSKTLYSVSMPHIAYAYYTVSTLTLSPQEIIDRCRAVGQRAFERLLTKISSFLATYNKLAGTDYDCPWDNRVVTYAELLEENRRALGAEFDAKLEAFTERLIAENPDMDERDLTSAIVMEAIKLSPDTDPRIVIAYMPPFYTHSINLEQTYKEKLTMSCAQATADYSLRQWGQEWELCKICIQLSDISYCNCREIGAAVEALQPNMPLLGKKYNLPLADLAKFDAPALNLGYVGKGIHENWERLYLPFAMNILPDVLLYAVRYLLQSDAAKENE